MPTYYHPVVTNSHSSSLSNPCPDGTAIGYGDWNGTILVICDAAFVKLSSSSENLALGLGLGLGIPGFLGLLWLFIVCYRSNTRIFNIVNQRNLSDRAMTDLENNHLTELLKQELREMKAMGHNLERFVRLAQGHTAMEVAVWIEALIRGEEGRIIQVEVVD